MADIFDKSLSNPDKDNSIPPPPRWPELKDDAKYGWAWDVAQAATEHSEADPVAVYFQALTYAAAAFGTGSWIDIGDTKHPPRIFVFILGASAKARKGTSLDPVKRVISACNDSLNRRGLPPLKTTAGPLSSGEGLVNAVRDPSEKLNDEGLPEDPGIKDKRLVVASSEVSSALDAIGRTGNILSSVMRCFWESGDQDPLTKNNPTRCTGAHVNIIGHITIDEFKAKTSSVELVNGFVNRFMFCCTRRTKYVSRPLPTPQVTVDALGAQLADAVIFAQSRNQPIDLDEQAIALWDRAYIELTQDVPGVLGAATSRGEAYVLRLAMVLALLDRSNVITVDHLSAAIEIWQFSFASAEFIFGNSCSDSRDKVVQILKDNPPLKWSELQRKAQSEKIQPDALRETVAYLQSSNLITMYEEERFGRGQKARMIRLNQAS